MVLALTRILDAWPKLAALVDEEGSGAWGWAMSPMGLNGLK